MKPVAPHGEHLRKRILNGEWEIILICMGIKGRERSIELLSHFPATSLYIPYKESPYRYFWPIAGCEIHLVDTGQSTLNFIKHCVQCFFEHGAQSIYVTHQSRHYHFKEQAHVT